MKNIFKRYEQKVSNTPSKTRLKKVIAGTDFQVWRQRWPQVGPKESPRHLPGSNSIQKDAKMEVKMEARIV